MAIQNVTGASAARLGGIGSQTSPVPGAARGGEAGVEKGPSFADTLESALGEVSQLQETSQNAIQSFLRGEAIELHEVMAAAEEAGIALEMLVEMRNKLTDAYRSVMQMQA
jgi:flagellar hook-basal body complex protein FliE